MKSDCVIHGNGAITYKEESYLMAKLSEQEKAKLKETLRGFLNNTLRKYPKAGPGILRKLWGELLEEKFGPPPKQHQNKNPNINKANHLH